MVFFLSEKSVTSPQRVKIVTAQIAPIACSRRNPIKTNYLRITVIKKNKHVIVSPSTEIQKRIGLGQP